MIVQRLNKNHKTRYGPKILMIGKIEAERPPHLARISRVPT